jgi:hypothetical protein
MFWFCSGRILPASAYYKNLDSRARLFKKLDTRQSKILNQEVLDYCEHCIFSITIYYKHTFLTGRRISNKLLSLANSSNNCELRRHEVSINNVTQPVADFRPVMCCPAEAMWTIQCRGLKFGNRLVFLNFQQVRVEILVEKQKEFLTAGYIVFLKNPACESHKLGQFVNCKTKTLYKITWCFWPKIKMLKCSWEVSMIIFVEIDYLCWLPGS